jgi:phage terminase large subunit
MNMAAMKRVAQHGVSGKGAVAPSRRDIVRAPFVAYGAALELWKDKTSEEILIEGPAGTGKTRTVLEKVHFCMMKYPGSRGLLVRKTKESLNASVLATFEEEVVPPDSPILKGPQRRFRNSYRYPNGSILVVGGMDKATKVMSAQYDIIATFETTELTEEDLENLTTRLRNGVMPYQQIISDCNPDVPQHWLNQRPKKTGMRRLLSRHRDNPTLYNHKLGRWTDQGAKYLKKLNRLSGVRKLRLFNGIWAAAEGLVYEEFEPDVHILPRRIHIPPEWKKIRVIDFGFRDPFVCQWWAINPEGDMYRYLEIYHTGRTVRAHAAKIRELSGEEKYEATICDWDAEDRATLHEEGIYTIPAYKDIIRGYQNVQERLRKQGPRNRPRLFLLPDSLVELDEDLAGGGQPTCTEEEFPSYAFKKKQDGKPNKEEPQDIYNHGMDTTRYAAAWVDNLASYRVKTTGAAAVAVKQNGATQYTVHRARRQPLTRSLVY